MDEAVLPTFSSCSDSLSDETGVEEEEGNLKEKKNKKRKDPFSVVFNTVNLNTVV